MYALNLFLCKKTSNCILQMDVFLKMILNLFPKTYINVRDNFLYASVVAKF